MSFARAPLRASLRSLPRSAPSPSPIFARHGSSRAYASQKMSGIQASSLGLAALLGWSAVFFTVTRPNKKEHHAKKVATPPTSSSDAPSTAAESSHSAEVDTTSSDSESQSPAYDPVTGEINWACPCLGGMADGPCGEEFKAAFSCFIYSEEEVKGVDCVDKFRGMQECFRKYPEIYGNVDAEDEEELDDADLIAAAELALKEEDKFFSSA
ncbi:hypothetical protein BCR35DRAFT_308944 [Leucosporidium creatinivorum]|uniref:Mitochondrial intermembrane space import and assembly protein 40 n=1 Tax=Leucosporidium creatinivorum TaxID=106004 RepID=A0A1Y2DTV9_9BASI|nr:hypothetical protein BCR35DRAFT_308944 [Leucosporidium creatinivorum]